MIVPFHMSYTIVKHTNGMHVIRLDEKDVKRFPAKQRVLCTVNNSITYHGAVMRTKEGWHYVNIGMDKIKKLGLKPGAKVQLQLSKDETEFQFDMPEEFHEVLDMDPEAAEVFETLTPGNRRGIIYLVSKLKSTDKRIEKALHIADMLKHGITSPRIMATKKSY